MAKKYMGGKDSLRAFLFAAGMDKLKQCSVFSMTMSEGEVVVFFIFWSSFEAAVANRLQCVHSNRMQPWQKAFFRRKKTDSFKEALTVKRADAGKILRLRLKERRELWWYGMMGIYEYSIYDY